MTKEVLVSITGVHMINGEMDDVAVITPGSYYFKNGRHFVLYDEVIDGVPGTVRNTLKIGKDAVDIIKTGPVQSRMSFEKERPSMNCYETPMGQIMVGVNTNEITISESEDRMTVKVDYTLDINYQEMSRCLISVDIQSKATAVLFEQR